MFNFTNHFIVIINKKNNNVLNIKTAEKQIKFFFCVFW